MNPSLFKKVAEGFERDLLMGRAKYYAELSLKRPLTDAELERYREICKTLGADVK